MKGREVAGKAARAVGAQEQATSTHIESISLKFWMNPTVMKIPFRKEKVQSRWFSTPLSYAPTPAFAIDFVAKTMGNSRLTSREGSSARILTLSGSLPLSIKWICNTLPGTRMNSRILLWVWRSAIKSQMKKAPKQSSQMITIKQSKLNSIESMIPRQSSSNLSLKKPSRSLIARDPQIANAFVQRSKSTKDCWSYIRAAWRSRVLALISTPSCICWGAWSMKSIARSLINTSGPKRC